MGVDFTSKSASRIARAVLDVENSTLSTLIPRRNQRTRGGGTSFIWGQIAKWNNPGSTYEWNQVTVNDSASYPPPWIPDPNGMSSTGVGSGGPGSQDEDPAEHWSRIEALPVGLLIRLQKITGDLGVTYWKFDVPVEKDASVVHREEWADTPTYALLEDLTMTEEEAKSITTVAHLAAFKSFCGGNAAGNGAAEIFHRGWMRTEMIGITWNDTDKSYDGHFVDREYDAMGRGPLSQSILLTTKIVSLGPC